MEVRIVIGTSYIDVTIEELERLQSDPKLKEELDKLIARLR